MLCLRPGISPTIPKNQLPPESNKTFSENQNQTRLRRSAPDAVGGSRADQHSRKAIVPIYLAPIFTTTRGRPTSAPLPHQNSLRPLLTRCRRPRRYVSTSYRSPPPSVRIVGSFTAGVRSRHDLAHHRDSNRFPLTLRSKPGNRWLPAACPSRSRGAERPWKNAVDAPDAPRHRPSGKNGDFASDSHPAGARDTTDAPSSRRRSDSFE